MSNTTIDIPLRFGIAQNIDAKLLPNGVLTRAENARLRKDARFGKRYGVSRYALPTSSITAYNQVLASHEGRQLLVAGETAYSRQQGAVGWTACGHSPGWEPRRTIPVESNTRGSLLYVASAVSGSYVCTASVRLTDTSLEVFGAVHEASSGTLVADEMLDSDAVGVSGGLVARIVPITGGFVIAVCSGGTLRFKKFTNSSLTWGTSVQIATGVQSASFDIADDLTDPTKFILVYHSGATTLTAGRVTVSTGVVSPSSTRSTGAGPHLCTIRHCTELIWISWVENPSVSGAIKAANFTTVFASPSSVHTVVASSSVLHAPAIARTDSQTVLIFYSQFGAADQLETKVAVVDDNTGLTGTSTYYNVEPVSRPFYIGVSIYIWVSTVGTRDDESQQTYRLWSLTQAMSGGRTPWHLSFGVSGGVAANGLPQPYITADGEWVFGTGLRQIAGDPTENARPAVFVYSQAIRQQCAKVGNCLYVAGGSLGVFDGRRLFDCGFGWYPTINSLAEGTGGALTLLGTYTYVLVYEYTDAAGQRHRSEPSVPVTITLTGSNNKVTIATQGLWMTSKGVSSAGSNDNQIAVTVYRTENNGTVLHLVTTASTAPRADVDALVSFVDGQADTTIADNEVLYTVGGPLPNFTPPSARLIAASASRVALAGMADPHEVLVSKLIVPGEPVQFADHDAFRIASPEPVTAVWFLDGALVVFSKESIYVVFGDGPDDTGNGQFNEPRRLPSAVGCSDWRSVVEMPDGLIFASSSGFYLLPRGFTPAVPLDGPRDIVTSYPVITSAATVRSLDENLVRWTLVNREPTILGTLPDDGRVLTLDLRSKQWSSDSYNGDSLMVSTQWVDTWAAAGVYQSSAVGLIVEDRTSYADRGGNFVPTILELGDLRPFGVQDRGLVRRVHILGEYRGACTLMAEASYDGGQTYPDTVQWNLTGLTAGDTVRKEWQLSRVQIDNVRFRLSDISLSGPTEGFVFNALTVHVDRKRGVRRRPPGDR